MCKAARIKSSPKEDPRVFKMQMLRCGISTVDNYRLLGTRENSYVLQVAGSILLFSPPKYQDYRPVTPHYRSSGFHYLWEVYTVRS